MYRASREIVSWLLLLIRWVYFRECLKQEEDDQGEINRTSLFVFILKAPLFIVVVLIQWYSFYDTLVSFYLIL